MTRLAIFFLFAAPFVSAAGGSAWAAPGPAPFRSALAEYNAATGEIIISVNAIVNWYVHSPGNLTGDPAQGLTQLLTSDDDDFIGEGGFISFSYTDLNLGPVAKTGLGLDDFVFKYSWFGASEEVDGELTIINIPEPTAFGLATLGVCGLATRRRRCAA